LVSILLRHCRSGVLGACQNPSELALAIIAASITDVCNMI
jgi:hypothetical protein